MKKPKQDEHLEELRKMTALLNEIHIDIHELADAMIPRDERPVETLAGEDNTDD